MKTLSLMHAIPIFLIAVTPVTAQSLPAPQSEEQKGFDLMEEGAKLLFRGLMHEMEPALNEMGKALTEMEPALQNLMALIDDIRNYDAPQMLENGDILIPRRKGLARPQRPNPLSVPEAEIEL